MISKEIEEIKKYMNDLLVHEKFDSFYLYEARIKTVLDFFISGKINKDFFDSKEDMELAMDGEQIGEYITWREVKHTIFDIIKGKRLPISFKLILMFNSENVARLVEMNNLAINPEDVSALFLHIYYENGKLVATSGTSLKIFTLDKSIEKLWDETLEKYYI